ncbi:hypothetical protein KVR01_007581 [Diaporthe batatas]|uniref:uncharacterized protein n=1 Tax=Diaporthe batatas TaxID=748121 RepID=UPI001D03CEFA|nr:uncharacterized protein KVR01_007581 [Diaporthe batatas]KAG8163103.1 hypothetical protein KVR01_007581 [Diaporthe batatas]
MAWGKSKPKPPPSLLGQLLPLVILFVVVAVLVFVGYHVYQSANKMSGSVSERMGKKNVVWTKDGVKVGLKHVENEREVDATQRWVVNAWNLSSDKSGKKNK